MFLTLMQCGNSILELHLCEITATFFRGSELGGPAAAQIKTLRRDASFQKRVEVEMQRAKRFGRTFGILASIAATIGLGLVGRPSASPIDSNALLTDRDEQQVVERIARLRERSVVLEQMLSPDLQDGKTSSLIAQWYNWPNWPNFWRDWSNWPNHRWLNY